MHDTKITKANDTMINMTKTLLRVELPIPNGYSKMASVPKNINYVYNTFYR